MEEKESELNVEITNLRNTGTQPGQLRASMPKSAPSMQTHGQISGKNTRERAVDCQRNGPQMVSALNQNPFAKSFNSWA